MKLGWQPDKWLKKKTKLGFRGYPQGTVAFYGPDNRRASKAAVSIFVEAGSDPVETRRWFSETDDLRQNAVAISEIAKFLRDHDARTITMVDGILGCPHEEGIDYPEGKPCPQCPFWAGRDRWSGE